MLLDEVPVVALELGGHRKFIVARLTDAGGREKIVFRAQRKVSVHIDLVRDLEDEVEGSQIRVRCIGGGIMFSSAEENIISLAGYSQKYDREPDRASTVAMLKEAYPGFTVKPD